MFVISVPFFDLDQIYMLYGRQLNWIKVSPRNYVVVCKDKAVGVSQQGPGNFDNSRDRLMFHCSEDEFFDMWFNYFDFRTDYQDLFRSNESLRKKKKFQSSGLHMVKRPLLESLVCSFLSFKSSTFDCQKFVELYGIKHKNSFRSLGAQTWYEFPDLEKLREVLSGDKEAMELLDAYEWLETMTNDSSKEISEFMDDLGLSKDLIQNLLLFGYNRFDVFPKDDFLDVYLEEEYRIKRKDLRKNESKGYLWLLLQFEMNFPGYDPIRWNLGLTMLKEGKISEREFEYEYCK